MPDSMARGDLIPWPDLNPRHRFDDEPLGELRESLAKDGMLQPIGVKLNPKAPHWIYAGERRWRAAEGILEEVPVVVRDIDETAARRLALTENIQRSQLTAMEEAWGIQRYIDASGATQTEVAEQLGKTQGWVSNRLRLLRLTEEQQTWVQIGMITPTQARDLILPFSALTDELWGVFTAGVDAQLAKLETKVWDHGTGRALTDEEIRFAVSKVAVSMSGWLDQVVYGQEGWTQKETDRRDLRIPKRRWKKAPAGTVIRYSFGDYPHGKSSRAFDKVWWDDEIERERKAAQKRREKQRNEFAAQEELELEDLEWTPDLGEIPADVNLPAHQEHVVFEPLPVEGWAHLIGQDTLDERNGHGPREVLGVLYADPTEIPEAMLVLRRGPGGPGYRMQSRVLCTEAGVWEAAVTALEEKRKELVDREVAALDRQEVEESEEVEIASEAAAVAFFALAIAPYRYSALEDVVQDMGLKPWDRFNSESPETPVDWLAALEPDQRQDLMRRVAWRVMNERPRYRLVEGAVHTRLKRRLMEELASKVAFELPAYQPEETIPDDEEDDDGTEE